MTTPFLAITIGTASANAAHAADLGKLVTVNGKTYRLVKANAAISAAANKVLARTAGTAGTWTVDTTTTANNALVAGVVPAGQTGSTGTTGLVSGDYFYIQVAGEATPLIHTTATAVSTGLSTATTAGTCDAVSGTFAATTPGAVFAVVLVASSGADAATQCRLVNLI